MNKLENAEIKRSNEQVWRELEDAKAEIEHLKAVNQSPDKDEKTWCEYVAGIICTYLNEPYDGTKHKGITGIIERRLWALPMPQTINAPLTDEQIDSCIGKVWGSVADFYEFQLFARLIEAAMKEQK